MLAVNYRVLSSLHVCRLFFFELNAGYAVRKDPGAVAAMMV